MSVEGEAARPRDPTVPNALAPTAPVPSAHVPDATTDGGHLDGTDLPDDLRASAVLDLRAQLTRDGIASPLAAAILALLSWIHDTPWGLVLAGLIVAMALVRAIGWVPLRRGELGPTLRWITLGSWGIAVAAAAIVPDALPILVFDVIGPLVTIALYLDERTARRYSLVGATVAVAVALIGLRAPGTGLEDAAARWFFDLVIMSYLSVHVLIITGLVGTVNRIRVDAVRRMIAVNRALHERDDELRRSRRRVVTAGDRERVRIERDLHDGAQQRLVAVAVRLRLAGELADAGNPPTSDQLMELHEEARAAIAELRDLARGIYPSVLADRGLTHALQQMTRRAGGELVVGDDVDLATIERDDAAALYFVCLEALQNVAKHGGDRTTPSVHVERRLDQGGTVDAPGAAAPRDALVVTISDDGPGFDVDATGESRGLLNMSDRVGALGGSLAIDSSPGRGTRLTIVAPIARADPGPSNTTSVHVRQEHT